VRSLLLPIRNMASLFPHERDLGQPTSLLEAMVAVCEQIKTSDLFMGQVSSRARVV
jgi:hypothetical protein